MEPVSIGLLVAYIIIVAIALERSYRVHSLKLKCAVSDKNTEDLAHERRAFIIATLVAYYAMSRWLENFAYKTTLSWLIFAVAGLVSLFVALLTVSWQSLRAASRNPVEALKNE